MTNDIAIRTSEMKLQLANKEVQQALLTTVFKGFAPELMRVAILEGTVRGFTLQDFLEKNVYAIGYGKTYSLVTSIGYARKIAMKSGQAGKTEPVYEEKEGKIISCSVTVKKVVSEQIGDFIAKVYFEEYYAGNKDANGIVKKNQWGEVKPTLWDTKPRTMIAKVAEMHALRMAFPELSEAYVEEEMVKEALEVAPVAFDNTPYRAKIEATTTLVELKTVWSALPANAKVELAEAKDSQKKLLTPLATPPILTDEEIKYIN